MGKRQDHLQRAEHGECHALAESFPHGWARAPEARNRSFGKHVGVKLPNDEESGTKIYIAIRQQANAALRISSRSLDTCISLKVLVKTHSQARKKGVFSTPSSHLAITEIDSSYFVAPKDARTPNARATNASTLEQRVLLPVLTGCMGGIDRIH